MDVEFCPMSMVQYLGLPLSWPPSPLELTPQTLLLPGCSPHQPQSQDMEKSHCASQEMENVMNALYVKKIYIYIVAATAWKLNWSKGI